ncbi:MAG: DNA polymerase, partial [Candidatus Dojkabacteria bacterium]
AKYKKKVEVVGGQKLIVLNKDRAVRYNEHLVLATLKGQRLKDKFMQNNLAVASLKEAVEDKAITQKFLRGLDGRRLYVRSKHSSLNLLLQSAGALIMKKALTIAYEKLKNSEANGLYKFVNNVHDEFQIETHKEVAELVGQLVVESIREVQVAFNLNCPLDGEAKIGKTWADTH